MTPRNLLAAVARRTLVGAMAFASWRRKCVVRLLYPGVRFGRGVHLHRATSIRCHDGGTIEIGEGSSIHDGSLVWATGGHVRIGRRAMVQAGTFIVSTAGIAIGDDALIAEHVSIRDQDHPVERNGIPFNRQGRLDAPIAIGDNVWLGAKVTVTRGVTIPSDTVVGANAVVTRSLDGAQLFGGVPARALTRRPPPEASPC